MREAPIRIYLLVVAASVAATVDAFGGANFHRPVSIAGPLRPTTAAAKGGRRARLRATAGSSDELLSLLSSDEGGEKDEDEGRIKDAIAVLESSFRSEDDGAGRFEPLIGLYEVKSVLTVNEGDNPVGGKWTRKNGLAQKLFRTRTTFQHLLPLDASRVRSEDSEGAVAEAVNVVSLDALDGLLRVTVILRGDAVPLSEEERLELNTNRTITPLTDLAVRAHFDPPRIYFGKRKKGNAYSYLPLQVGPTSSVILDTTYFDKAVRIGMGGTSGTRFVFASTAGEEAEEYKALLDQPSSGSKRRALTRLGVTAAAGLYVASGSRGFDGLKTRAAKVASTVAKAKVTVATLSLLQRCKPLAATATRILAGVAAFVSGMAMILIAFSSGGIERDGMSRESSPSP